MIQERISAILQIKVFSPGHLLSWLLKTQRNKTSSPHVQLIWRLLVFVWNRRTDGERRTGRSRALVIEVAQEGLNGPFRGGGGGRGGG